MSGHTKGPWRVGSITGANDKGHGYIYAADDELVGSVMAATTSDPVYSTDRILRGKANARLIAAAPELLEALQRILPHAESASFGGPDIVADMNFARAAIAKATGESA